LPLGYQKKQQPPALSINEIQNLVTAFAELGTFKIRLTGGEPTLRTDVVDIAWAIASIPGIKKVALSTNGYRLKNLVKPLIAAGVSALNVSVDSMLEARFKDITGHARLNEILEAIEYALSFNKLTIKINAVLLKGMNETELAVYLDWIKHRPVSIRFIELMQTGDNDAFFKRYHVPAQVIKQQLQERGFAPVLKQPGDGPAIEMMHPDYQGKIGLIAPYSKDFCNSCNRLRVSSQGALQLCLFGGTQYNVRHLLQLPSQKEELISRLIAIVKEKPFAHELAEGRYGQTQSFVQIGG